MVARIVPVLFSVLLAGCANLGYYAQAVSGHMDLLARRQPLVSVAADPGSPKALAKRLVRITVMREFAVDELALPDNASYRSYADLGRDFVVHSVVAAPALSLNPEQSCFFVVGCLSYRGYFRLEDASRAADALRARGLDVYVAPVPAYSTLGWFDDPVLNTLLHGPDWSVARLIFHELAHQRVFVAGDTSFNEAYATTVGSEGQRRWLERYGSEVERHRFWQAQQRRRQFSALVGSLRKTLEALYASERPEREKLEAKARILREVRAEYSDLKASWQGYSGYDRWFGQDLNNAKLALVAAYNALVPGFQGLLLAVDNDMSAFHHAVARLAREDHDTRRALLRECARSRVSTQPPSAAFRDTGPGTCRVPVPS